MHYYTKSDSQTLTPFPTIKKTVHVFVTFCRRPDTAQLLDLVTCTEPTQDEKVYRHLPVRPISAQSTVSDTKLCRLVTDDPS